jgi:5-methylthioadenosine/S-adenosylhomocysteine deaminase
LSSIAIRNATILTFDAAETIIEVGDIGIDGSEIVYVGRADGAPGAETTIDGDGCVALPGFVNAHTHLAMTLMRGFADDMRVQEWLEQKVWPTEERLERGDVYWGAMLGIVEMIRSGTTCFNDMYWAFDETLRAIVETGIRGCPSGVLIGVHPQAEQHLAQAIDFVRQCREDSHERVVPMFGPHAPYTCPDAMLRRVLAAAQELGVGIHIHISETKEEVEGSLREHGKTPVERFRDLGLFDVHVLAPHCVHPTESDIDVLAEYGVGIAHNPGSNMKLSSGIAPVPKMRSRGVIVGLGTDGAASNNNLDMLEEARLAALLHKVATGDPTVISAYEALAMATRESARALGIFDQVGSLEVGKKADIILIDLKRPHLSPRHNPVSHIVYAARASDVVTTIVHGEVLMRDGELTALDEEQIMREASRRAERLVG